jgi:hypothetical protein
MARTRKLRSRSIKKRRGGINVGKSLRRMLGIKSPRRETRSRAFLAPRVNHLSIVDENRANYIKDPKNIFTGDLSQFSSQHAIPPIINPGNLKKPASKSKGKK